MTKQRSPGWLKRMLDSGEFARAAKGCHSQNEMLRVMGISQDSFINARTRLVAATGMKFPSFAELQAQAPHETKPTVQVCASVKCRNCEDTGCFVCKPEPEKPPRTIADDLSERRERAEVSSLKARLKDALDQLEQCRFELGVATEVDGARRYVEPIVPRENASALREATACALASDWHIEERVDSASVNGVNEYNLAIARMRAQRFFSGFSYLTRYHQDHFQIRDGLLWLGGDLITGYLREENLEHNELSPVQAIAELHEWIAAGIRQYLNETQVERLRVVCNSGNHGRLTDKVRPSTREANSIEWLLYVGLAREFAHEERVEFVLPLGSQTYVTIYDLVIRFTHGDETKFGGGVGGIMIPIRKAIAKWQTVRHADVTAIGHYHQEHFLRDLLVNGSLIGYNNYGLSIAAPYEDPRQSFFLVDSRRGVVMPATIWVEEPLKQRRIA